MPDTRVPLEIAECGELLAAASDGADVGPLSCVDPEVCLEVSRSCEGPATVWVETREWLLACVSVQVALE